MSWRRLQFFFWAAWCFVAATLADPTVGQVYSGTIVDVDGNKSGTADGRVTVLVFCSTQEIGKAQTVGARIPGHCLANPDYRMITILRFEKKRSAPMCAIINAVTRHRLDAEAKQLQARYKAKNIARDPRKDVFAAADFDGAMGSQFGIPTDSPAFQVLALGRKGELLQRWTDVPTAAELETVLK
jgi:hypothetical protein